MNYIALDIGNVLCQLRQEHFTHEISYRFNTTLELAERFLKRVWELHDIGFTNIRDELIDNFGIKSEIVLDQLLNAWNNIILPDIQSIDIICKIKNEQDVKIAFLSNMGVEHVKLMEQFLHPIYDDAVKHFSCEVGARKPSKLYYQSFLSQYPEFKGCLYVDDIKENLKASEQFGFKPFHFDLRTDDYQKLASISKLL